MAHPFAPELKCQMDTTEFTVNSGKHVHVSSEAMSDLEKESGLKMNKKNARKVDWSRQQTVVKPKAMYRSGTVVLSKMKQDHEQNHDHGEHHGFIHDKVGKGDDALRAEMQVLKEKAHLDARTVTGLAAFR
jgi:hypothetical protein